MNLFGNSLKYTSRGVIKVTVTQTQLDGAPNQRMITLTVEDTGRGISQDFLRNCIFIPFSQEDQLSSGTGLGLSFVQRITSQLGGNVSITSQVGVGTRVTVSLPMLIDTSSTATDLLPRGLPDRQSTCHGLRMRLVSPIQNAGAAPHQEALSFNTLISDLCCEHLGMIMDTVSDVEKAAPDVLIVKNNATGDLLASATPWPEAPLLSPKKLERAVSRAINLSAEPDESPLKLVEMPLPTPSDTASCSQPPTPAPSSMESPFDGSIPAEDYFQVPQFLLVEDNPINLKMLTCFMKKLQKPYCTARNGEEAVSAYKKVNGQFKYILMDISMPVMDGLEATRQIRAFEQFNKITASTVFAITGLGSESAREEATRSGVDCFITKPVKLRELEAMLSSQGVTI
uniref:histidine kinase n=1 Tax=Fusarium oxysporum (strain Fo5176) TaxID=660025 RepID=A0A0D2YFB6_FUSOF